MTRVGGSKLVSGWVKAGVFHDLHRNKTPGSGLSPVLEKRKNSQLGVPRRQVMYKPGALGWSTGCGGPQPGQRLAEPNRDCAEGRGICHGPVEQAVSGRDPGLCTPGHVQPAAALPPSLACLLRLRRLSSRHCQGSSPGLQGRRLTAPSISLPCPQPLHTPAQYVGTNSSLRLKHSSPTRRPSMEHYSLI